MVSEPRQIPTLFQNEGLQNKALQTTCVLLVIAALVTAFWWPTLFDGKSLIHGDSIVHGLPLMDLLHRALHGEASVLWSEQIYGGHPIFAEGQGGFAHPLNILVAALAPPKYGANLFHFLGMLLLAGGTFGLCRTLGISIFAAGCAALAATFATVNIGAQQNLTISGSIAWIPWVFWAMEAWLLRPDAVRGVALGMACCLLILAGYPQVFHGVVVYMAASLLVLPLTNNGRVYLRTGWSRLMTSGVLAVVLCAGLAAVQVLPLLELTSMSHRSEGVGLLPFMPQDAAVYWRGFLYTLDGLHQPSEGYFPFVGSVLVCAAATLTLITKTPARAKGHLLATLLLIEIGIGVASPVFGPLYRHHLIPGLNFFRTMSTYLNVAAIGFGVLAAFGIDGLANFWQRQPASAWRRPQVIVALTLFCGGLAWIAAQFYVAVMPIWNLVTAVTAIAVVLLLMAPKRAQLIPGVLFVALTAECVLLHLHEIHFWNVSSLQIPAGRAQLQAATDINDYRFLDKSSRVGYAFLNSQNPNQEQMAQNAIATYAAMTNLISDVSSLNGALALPLKRRMLLDPVLEGETDGRSNLAPGLRAIDVLALRYVTYNVEASVPGFKVADHQPPPPTSNIQLNTWIMENTAARPRFQTYTRHQVVASIEDAVQVFRAQRDDALIIESAPDLPVANTPVNDPQALRLRVLKASSTRYEFDVDASQAGWLFVADANYPGWKATVDGIDSRVYSANVLGKAVAVAAGKHRVEMRFESMTFRIGLLCTIGSLLMAGAIVGVAWRKRIFITSHSSKGIA